MISWLSSTSLFFSTSYLVFDSVYDDVYDFLDKLNNLAIIIGEQRVIELIPNWLRDTILTRCEQWTSLLIRRFKKRYFRLITSATSVMFATSATFATPATPTMSVTPATLVTSLKPSVNEFFCRRCPEGFTSNSKLYNHVRERHFKKLATSTPSVTSPPPATSSSVTSPPSATSPSVTSTSTLSFSVIVSIETTPIEWSTPTTSPPITAPPTTPPPTTPPPTTTPSTSSTPPCYMPHYTPHHTPHYRPHYTPHYRPHYTPHYTTPHTPPTTSLTFTSRRPSNTKFYLTIDDLYRMFVEKAQRARVPVAQIVAPSSYFSIFISSPLFTSSCRHSRHLTAAMKHNRETTRHTRGLD